MCATLFLNENAKKFTPQAPPPLALVGMQTLAPPMAPYAWRRLKPCCEAVLRRKARPIHQHVNERKHKTKKNKLLDTN